MPAITAMIAGCMFALVLWVALFFEPVEIAPNRYQSAESAQRAAVDAGGRFRWPGTSVRAVDVAPGRVDVERRWMGLQESVVTVKETPAGWDLSSPRAGPGHALQVTIACIIPGLIMAGVVYAAMRARRTRQSRGGPTSAASASLASE